jgi:hypothetical protein
LYKMYGLDAHIQDVINSNHAVFTNTGSSNSTRQNSDSGSSFNWVWTLVWIVVMVIRMASSCN